MEPPDGTSHDIEHRHQRRPPAGTTERDSEPIKAIPVRHWGQWVSAVVVLALVAALVYSVATNDNLQWSVVGDNITERSVLRGLWVTIQLTVLSMVLGIALGIVVAVMRLSSNKVLSTVSWFYIWLFRGTPVLVQLLVWFNLALFFPTIGFGPLAGGHERPHQAVRRSPAGTRPQRGRLHG